MRALPPWLVMGLAAVSWGAATVLSKVSVQQLTGIDLLGIEVTVGAAALWGIVLVRGGPVRAWARPSLVVLGAAGGRGRGDRGSAVGRVGARGTARTWRGAGRPQPHLAYRRTAPRRRRRDGDSGDRAAVRALQRRNHPAAGLAGRIDPGADPDLRRGH